MVAPVVPLAGVAGLAFLDRTYERQFALFTTDVEVARDVAAFRERAAGIDTAGALVRDTRVLRVTLGAFGLEDELPKRAFIRKVVEEGTLDPRAFANRLADPAWRRLAETLGFGDLGNGLALESVRDDLVARYRERAFERAVGEQDTGLRLALNFRRGVREIAESEAVDRAGWFRIMGSRPLRAVVEGAFNLPDQFGSLDLDQQRAELESLARRRFGSESPAVFRDPAVVEEVVRDFLLRAQIEQGPGPLTRGTTALSILQGSGLGAGASAGLFSSNFL